MVKVLVLDDDPDLLEMVEIILRNHKMDVTCINKGSDLVDSIEQFNPDVVLMDIYLGDTDGRVLCDNLKKSSKYSRLPIILYSAGNISQASIDTSQANEFLTKPFEVTKLINVINSLAAA